MKTTRMRIPVFVSAPSPDNLNPVQVKSAEIIQEMVNRYKLEWRALGRSDYPNDVPLREVLRLIRHCSGGIILGFEQFRSEAGIFKAGSAKAQTVEESREKVASFPTAWNQLEAGMLVSSRLPLIIFKEKGVSGGIFDLGTSEVFVHQMPGETTDSDSLDDLDSVFQNWVARVRTKYYGD